MKREDIGVCILLIEGTNCEDETFHAFEALGARPERVHLNQLVRDVPREMRRSLEDYGVLVFPGGFSSGDYVRAGAIWAARVKSRLMRDLVRFIDEGKLVVGICNGYQVLVELGLLPAIGDVSDVPQAALATNDSARYECRPSLLRFENGGLCSPLKGFQRGQVMLAPSAHTEGKLTFPKGEEKRMVEALLDGDQVLFRYVDAEGRYAGYPWNPNGSIYNIAGICDPHGNVLGLMPHPERSFHRYLHPDWTRGGNGLHGDGRLFFESLLDHATKTS
ncbi:MAG: phosphoribosylformylglycinamidine synthase subunit PurQ [Thermoplasmata archaeon]